MRGLAFLVYRNLFSVIRFKILRAVVVDIVSPCCFTQYECRYSEQIFVTCCAVCCVLCASVASVASVTGVTYAIIAQVFLTKIDCESFNCVFFQAIGFL